MKGDQCASGSPCYAKMAPDEALPRLAVVVNGQRAMALIDTGCTTTLLARNVAKSWSGACTIKTVDGRDAKCLGETTAEVTVQGVIIMLRALVLDHLVGGVDVVLGMKAINQLGGATLREGQVTFGRLGAIGMVGVEGSDKIGSQKPEACCIKDEDFLANFDGERWTVEWKWTSEPPELRNKVGCYNNTLHGEVRKGFEEEVERWIQEGILKPWTGEEKGLLPLMAVVQPTKNKVRPVLDYRELNKHVACHTGKGIDVCEEVMRTWRRMRQATRIVDLKSAYLQIHVDKKLWQYQLVKYKGRLYCLTRLGFGLSSAPKIMTAILKTALKGNRKVNKATSSYIDDILVEESEVTAEEVRDHVETYGLTAKPAEPLDGGTALGLKLQKDEKGTLIFKRGNEVPEVGTELTKRELFSICGKLVGHYPIAGWLRIACSFIKRQTGTEYWEDRVANETLKMMKEVITRVKREDPVKGEWHVSSGEAGVVWCDASSLALGVILEMGGVTVEDAAWLRKKNDFSHVNVAELDAVMKGINLTLKWGLRVIEIKTDSATVASWVRSAVTGDRRIKTKGAAEMLIKRRLGALEDLITEFHLKVSVMLVPSEKNKADVLTRVKKAWLQEGKSICSICCAGEEVKELHDMHHFGQERTLFLAREVNPEITKEEVREVVENCGECQSIDPRPSRHEAGELHVAEDWKRLAIDITHYRHKLYLTMVDCGPGRFAIWREVKSEAAWAIGDIVEQIFLERGPVSELLMDNGSAFRSEAFKRVCDKWGVRQFFRAAYRPSGNGIVERHHRTIKAAAERSNISPMEAVFWYNMSPKTGQREATVPHRAIFTYKWRHPYHKAADIEDEEATIKVGEEVWVKPPNAKCTSRWGRGVVTGTQSKNNVMVDGVPRHILDLRRVFHPASNNDGEEEEGEIRTEADSAPQTELNLRGEEPETIVSQRPQRERRRPAWMKDYEVFY